MAEGKTFTGCGRYCYSGLWVDVRFNSDGMSDNELIAGFIGGTKRVVGNEKLYGYAPGTILWIGLFGDSSPSTYLCFDNDWEWLMYVVEKIENDLLGQVEIHTAYTNINGEFNGEKYNQDTCFESQSETKRDVTYRAVVKFIKWYNQTPKP